MVFEHTAEDSSQRAAIMSIAAKIGCNPEALLSWMRRANEILKKAQVDSRSQRNSASKRAAGVSKSRVFRGRVLSFAAT